MLKSTNKNKTFLEIEKKISWLSNYIIHYANNIRHKEDDLKVGGHQASSASVVSILVVLYFKIINKYDRIAIKPHASPVFHAIQYLLNNQNIKNLKNFRKLDGAQAYPSKTKDFCDVDFSTGSVGLGGAMTIFSSFTQDFLKENQLLKTGTNKMISIFGDAELDEGNVYEALLEGAKHNLKNCWWIIDYNRQSLDGIVYEKLFEKIINLFELMDWNVEILKYGSKLQKLKHSNSGKKILKWIDDCPNDLFSALTYQGGKDWRNTLLEEFKEDKKTIKLIQSFNNEELNELMTNLAGHDIESLENSFSKYFNSDKPTCFICYTVKGFGLPLAGHKDNHSGIMNNQQFSEYKSLMNIREGKEWDKTEGLEINIDEFNSIIESNPLYKNNREFSDSIEINSFDEISFINNISTQEAFGKIMNEIGKVNNSFTKRIVTTSPDVTVSTSLGGWVNKKNIFSTHRKKDIFGEKKVFSAQKWKYLPHGQHIELGIAENNLFLLLASLGISDKLFGTRLLPIGTIYDTFIGRGLDALNYATYIDARFILVGTPSGVTLSHEGGAHQSIITPNIGISQPNLTYYEPSFADELNFLFFWALKHIQQKDGTSIYFRLSTKKLIQPNRTLSKKDQKEIINGCYWFKRPKTKQSIILICTGVIIGEVEKMRKEIIDEEIDLGILIATSPDKLYADWMNSKKDNSYCHIEETLKSINRNSLIITIIDAHSSSLSWIGSVLGHKVYPMGINKFGQSGDLNEIYRYTNIDFKSIIDRIAKSIANN
ncbi:MAG: transketolase [Pelagibacterales bacterium]|nr:transketolase [Pelagibacterales bacterium]OUU62925.1 MAG: hypothetical protein CBC22_02495 [Alphaproteobacteria bacterium TMED62]